MTNCVRHQIECCVDEWSEGTWKESNWSKNRYETIYRSHHNTLHDLRNHGRHPQGGDVLTQIQFDLHKDAWYVSCFPSIMHTILPTLEAHTRVPHPILSQGQLTNTTRLSSHATSHMYICLIFFSSQRALDTSGNVAQFQHQSGTLSEPCQFHL